MAFTPTGTIAKIVNKTFTGGMTPTGTVTKSDQKLFAGGVTPTGPAAYVMSAEKTLTGGITPTGTLLNFISSHGTKNIIGTELFYLRSTPMYIHTEEVKITTVGGAGAAVGSGSTRELYGFLLDVYLNYHASCPATADVTISEATFGTICVYSNSATDVRLAPRMATQDIAGAATGAYDLCPLSGAITIAVAGADALTDCLVATVRWMVP